MEIREATEKDLFGILEILNFEIDHSTAVYEDSPRDEAYIQDWFKTKQQLNFPVYIAVENEKVLGFGTYGKYRPHYGFRFTVEHSIYLSSENRGKGIGKMLMEKLIQTAKNRGLHRMIAGIDAENIKSIAFHDKFGFSEVGRLTEVGFKFDRWLDLVFLQKSL